MRGLPVDWTDAEKWKYLHIDALAVALCVTMTLGVYFIALEPLRDQHADQTVKQEQLKAERQKSLKMEASVMAAEARLAGLQEALVQSQVQLEPADGVNRRMAEINDLASKSGLRIDGVQLGEATRTSRCIAVPIRLAGSGTYRKCMAFLRQLKEAFPDTAVTEFDLSADPGRPGSAAAFWFQLVWHASPARAKK